MVGLKLFVACSETPRVSSTHVTVHPQWELRGLSGLYESRLEHDDPKLAKAAKTRLLLNGLVSRKMLNLLTEAETKGKAAAAVKESLERKAFQFLAELPTDLAGSIADQEHMIRNFYYQQYPLQPTVSSAGAQTDLQLGPHAAAVCTASASSGGGFYVSMFFDRFLFYVVC